LLIKLSIKNGCGQARTCRTTEYVSGYVLEGDKKVHLAIVFIDNKFFVETIARWILFLSLYMSFSENVIRRCNSTGQNSFFKV
jgi:hypothetical protein